MEDNILLHPNEFYDEGIAYFYLYILDKTVTTVERTTEKTKNG